MSIWVCSCFVNAFHFSFLSAGRFVTGFGFICTMVMFSLRQGMMVPLFVFIYFLAAVECISRTRLDLFCFIVSIRRQFVLFSLFTKFSTFFFAKWFVFFFLFDFTFPFSSGVCSKYFSIFINICFSIVFPFLLCLSL